MNVKYDLTVISDENVPMAAFLKNSNTEFIIGMVIVTILTFLLYVYIEKCRKYRMRLCVLQGRVLEGNEKIRLSWNLWKLRSKIQELEAEAVSHMVL